jgi:hypothetical protein
MCEQLTESFANIKKVSYSMLISKCSQAGRDMMAKDINALRAKIELSLKYVIVYNNKKTSEMF